MILRWYLVWNASSCFASGCTMVQVSEPYILTSAHRMVQVSKPCIHTDITKHAYATYLINNELWSQDETHLAPYTTEIAHCWSCQADKMHYVWFAISVLRLFWLEISDTINAVSIHINWCIKWFSSKILNLGFLPRYIHSKRPDSWGFLDTWKYYWQQITKFLRPSPHRYFPHSTIQGIQRGLLAEEDSINFKENCFFKKTGSKWHITNFFEVSICS